jgi:hypothetical protein
MDAALLDLASLRQQGDHYAEDTVSHYMAAKFAPKGMDCEYMMAEIGG